MLAIFFADVSVPTAVKDLTSGSVPRHIILLAIPMAAGMVFQTLYYLVVPLGLLTIACQFRPDLPIGMFTKDAAVVAIGADFLRTISWNFVATGLIFTCSGMFQALGNTMPALFSSASRLVTFAVPALWLSSRAGFAIHEVWVLSVITVALQAALSLWLIRVELRRRLTPRPPLSMPEALA